MSSPAIDLGQGVSATVMGCSHGESTHALIKFDLPGEDHCEGIISWCGECPGEWPTWTLHSLDPFHVEPSVQCTLHAHHHGWIREGRWTCV